MDAINSTSFYKSALFNNFGQAAQLSATSGDVAAPAPAEMTTMAVGEEGGGVDPIVIRPLFYGPAPEETSVYLNVVDLADKLGNKDGVMNQTELDTFLTQERENYWQKQEEFSAMEGKVEAIKVFINDLPEVLQLLFKPVLTKVDQVVQLKRNAVETTRKQILAGQKMDSQFETFALAGDFTIESVSKNDINGLADNDNNTATLGGKDIQSETDGSLSFDDYKAHLTLVDKNQDGFASQQELSDFATERNKVLGLLKTLGEELPIFKPLIDKVSKGIREGLKVVNRIQANYDTLAKASTDDPASLSEADLQAAANKDGVAGDITAKDLYLVRTGSTQTATFEQIAQEADGLQSQWVNSAYSVTDTGVKDEQLTWNELHAYIQKLDQDHQTLLDQAASTPDQQTELYAEAHALRDRQNAARELLNRFYSVKDASADNPDTLSVQDIRDVAAEDGQAATFTHQDNYRNSTGSRSLSQYQQVLKEADERDASQDPSWYDTVYTGEEEGVRGDGAISRGDLWRIQQDYYEQINQLNAQRQAATDAAEITQLEQQIRDVSEKRKIASRMVQHFNRLDNDTGNDAVSNFTWGYDGLYQASQTNTRITANSLKTAAAKDSKSDDVSDTDVAYQYPNPWDNQLTLWADAIPYRPILRYSLDALPVVTAEETQSTA